MLLKRIFYLIFITLISTGSVNAGIQAKQVDFLASGVLKTNGTPNSYGYVTFKDITSSATKNVYSSKDKTYILSQPVRLDVKGAANVFCDGNYNLSITDKTRVLVNTYDGYNYEVSVTETGSETNVLTTYGTSTSQLKVMLDAISPSLKYTLLFPASTYYLSESIVFPSNCTLHVMNGAKFEISTGITPSFNGHIIAGQYNIFTGSGTPKIALNTNSLQYESWFTDNTDRVNISTLYVTNITGKNPDGVVFNEATEFQKSVLIDGNLTVVGSINASISGVASSSIYSQDSDKLDAQHGAYYQDASNLNAGNIAGARVQGVYGGIIGIGNCVSLNVTTLNATAVNGTILTASQPNIITVNGINISALNSSVNMLTTSCNNLSAQTLTILSSYVTANSSPTFVTVSATALSGTLQTAAQSKITSVGTLSSLGITGALSGSTGSFSGGVTSNVMYINSGGLVVNGTATVTTVNTTALSGTLQTAAQPKITSLGALTALNVSGNVKVDGALTVSGDIGWTNFSATTNITGWVSFSTKIIRYKKVDKIVYMTFYLYGVSNSEYATITLPVPIKTVAETYHSSMTRTIEGSTFRVGFASASTTDTELQLYKDATSSITFATSGYKSVAGEIFYETD